MEYDEQDGAVTYHSDKPTGPTAGSETTDALEFLAKLTSHIPDKNQVLQRYYGHYASRVRGMRRKAAERDEIRTELPLVTVQPEPEAVREAKRRWAELPRRILEVEPLRCPRCGETTMRIVAFISEPKTIDSPNPALHTCERWIETPWCVGNPRDRPFKDPTRP